MIHAYNELYLSNAMTTMATMIDYAVNYKNKSINDFFDMFIDSGVALQFEQGNPTIIAGKSGVDLYLLAMGEDECVSMQYHAFDRTPEFWVGYALSYYQWYSARTFREIIIVISPRELLEYYWVFHEMDIMRFVEKLDEKLKQRKTNLEYYRNRAGLSQAQLSNLSCVSIRSIQMYEQRKNDVAKAQINILIALAKTLNCNVYDLLDSNITPYKNISI